MPKPGDFYVGVVELFAVLLPGALLMAALLLTLVPLVPAPFDGRVSVQAQWVAFAFGAYALGAFVFPVASLIDDRYYNPYRERRWPKADDHAYAWATDLRQRYFHQPQAARDDIPMNTFAWAKAVLMLHAPGAFNDVQRFEAESKFFRSLVVVLPVVGGLAMIQGVLDGAPGLVVGAPIVALVLARLSFHRYAERRHKSTEWAYRYLVTLKFGSEPGG
ncbi:hypothetical protein [Phenylobacterium sp.]|uniref:hypothetical protein n=1 Tax=Phenylobacterium sp. TaxID=1871053 RepID=UPI0025FB701A|nr:hypothetical protein [Phenylobacterium sp.]